MAACDELVAAVADRYARGDRGERGRILDEFAAVTGYHRKHTMRLLRAGQVNRRCGPRPGRRIYDEAVREALIVVWRDPTGSAQTAAAAGADPGRGDGAARPSPAGAGGAHQILAMAQDDRSGIAKSGNKRERQRAAGRLGRS